MNKSKFYLLSLLIVLLGCSNESKNDKAQLNDECQVIDIDKVKTEGIVKYSDVFDGFKVIPLETKKESLIGEISSIRFCGDYIVVLDRRIGKSIYVFDMDGKFLRTIGKLGKGPGEYINPSSISTNTKTNEILVYDAVQDRIQIYSIEGELTKVLPLKKHVASKSIEVYNGNIYISNHINSKTKYLFDAIDFTGKTIGRWGEIDSDNSILTKVASSNIFFRNGNRMRFRSWMSSVIFDISENSVTEFLRLESKKQITDDWVKRNSPDTKLNDYLFKEFTGILGYAESGGISYIDFAKEGNRYTLFYNELDKSYKCVEFINFKDDLTHIGGRVNGAFLTSYEDNLITIIPPVCLQNFLIGVERGLVSDNEGVFTGVNENSNPVVIFYKSKKQVKL